MTSKETANIIIWLRRRGLNEEEINDLLGFVATHNPTEKEMEDSKNEAGLTRQYP